jgi:hypothetical protein
MERNSVLYELVDVSQVFLLVFVVFKLIMMQRNKKPVVLLLLWGQGREGRSFAFNVGNLGVNRLAWLSRRSSRFYVNVFEHSFHFGHVFDGCVLQAPVAGAVQYGEGSFDGGGHSWLDMDGS